MTDPVGTAWVTRPDGVTRKVQIFPRSTSDDFGTEISAVLGDKLRHLERIMGGSISPGPPRTTSYADLKTIAAGRRTVRILFHHETGRARADELCGGRVIEPITDRCWRDRDEVEILARLYSVLRQIPVSRVDVP